MASVTFRVGTADTDASPNTSGAFTPNADELLVVFLAASATVTATATCVGSTGLTFTQFAEVEFATSAHRLYGFVADALATNVSQTVTCDTGADPANGTVIHVFSVAGMSKTGLTAVRQSAETNNGAGGTPPVATFSAAALTDNPTLGACAGTSNPLNVTPPTNWTEPAGGDIGYATPNIGCECVFRDSGFTGTTVTWGSNAGAGTLIVELDASASAVPRNLLRGLLSRKRLVG